MTVYWLMFAWPASITFLFGEIRTGTRSRIALGLLFLVFVVLIGLRQCGGDWDNYEAYTEVVSYQSLSTTLSSGEAGFGFVTWLSTVLDWDIYGSTTFCALVLMYGLVRFAQRQPDTWLAITAAVPYLIIVVGMGYIRQAAAIGFIMLALIAFEDNKKLLCGLFIILATLFHVSAIIIIPFIAIVLSRKSPLYLIPIILGALPAVLFMIASRYDYMMDNYINTQYDSSGALIRLLMNAIPSVLFLAYRKRFAFDPRIKLLWTILTVSSCLMIFAFVLIPSSTVLDRIGLYLIPIQIMVFGHIPVVLARKKEDARLISTLAVLYFACVQFIWLNYATNAGMWVPYRSLLSS